MIATRHGVYIISSRSGTSLYKRFESLLMKLEREVSIDVLMVELEEVAQKEYLNIPLSVIKIVKQAYLERIRECWFVPLNLFLKKLTYKLTRSIRKTPDPTDRIINKRKTFLKSLV